MYIYTPDLQAGELLLNKESAQHIKARRLKPGGNFKLFDGKGLVATAQIIRIDRREVEVFVEDVSKVPMPSHPKLVIGLTKLPTLEFILQKSVEVGVGEIIIIQCDNTPIRFDQQMFSQKHARWEKIVISACEQSESLYKPDIHYYEFQEYISQAKSPLMLHPYANKIAKPRDLNGNDIMIGPEGGFSEDEVRCVENTLKLDCGILRADTAVIAALLYAKL